MTSCYFIRPLDIVSARGNRSFGASGEYGEVSMPPWPSLFAGALRSAMLGRDSKALSEFVRDNSQPAGPLGEVLGTPERPGSFRLEWASLGRMLNDGSGEAIVPLPADLVASSSGLSCLTPTAASGGVNVSFPLPMIPVLRTAQQTKPEPGRYLAGSMLDDYVAGKKTLRSNSLETRDLYKRETRVGVALDNGTRTVEEGALYGTEAISFYRDYGFVVQFSTGDIDPSTLLPVGSLLRLGGDGKAATCEAPISLRLLPEPPLAKIARDRQFRLVLSTPGIFRRGWLPDSVQDMRLVGDGFEAKLVCAAVSRATTISGWDLAKQKPKPAQRIAPAGSVYWFNDFQGDPGKLAAWVAEGLWDDKPDELRRAEGFNRAMVAAWPKED